MKKICISLLLTTLLLSTSLKVSAATNNSINNEILPLSEQEVQLDQENFIKAQNKIYSKSSSLISPLAEPGVPVSKTLSTTGYMKQPDSTTCSPASAYNLLKTLGYSPNFTSLKTNIKYTYNDGTPLGSNWTSTLNSYLGKNYYTIRNYPSSDQLWSCVVADISDNHPLILDAYMSSKTGRLPGYSGTVYHYLTGIGYRNHLSNTSSRQVVYYDPYNRSGYPNGTYTADLSKIAPIVGAMGVVW